MKIRRGRMSDAQEILKILKETPELQGNKEEETIYTLDFVRGSMKKTDRDFVLVAEIDGKIAGFLMAELWKHKRYSFLMELFVKPEFRKQKVASKLFLEYENYCRKNNMNALMALVLVKNKKMQEWCKKKGIIKGNKMYFYEKKLK